jgi:hypothetical protein
MNQNTANQSLQDEYGKSAEPAQVSNMFSEIDTALSILAQKKNEWVTLKLEDKINLLEDVLKGILSCAQEQVADALVAKGLPSDSPLASEDWLGGPYANARIVGTLLDSLRSLSDHGHTGVTAKDAYTLGNGQVAVKVLPKRLMDHLLVAGFKGEVRLMPNLTEDTWLSHCAHVYKNPPSEGKVSLVLGAGNVASIGLLDVIHKLYVEAQVCLLKFNPVNEYLEPHYRSTLKPLIEAGYVRLIKGEAEEGKYLCQHELVDEIHITGSDRTHDAIVYGTGEEGAQRKTNDEPLCTKRVSSELGNVSPVIIVPGSWTQRQIKFHAENIATMMYNNVGFNCNAARVLIMQKDWPQKRALLNALREVLSSLEARPSYYPGAVDRHKRFIESHDGAELIATQSLDGTEGALPIGLVVEVDPNDIDHTCFREEAFCAMTATTSLDTSDAQSFLRAATKFANEVLWGTLNATIIIDPQTEKTFKKSLEKALDELKYGSVCVNHWPALSYGLGSTTWGAYPGHTRSDIQSGVGVVHNTYLLEHVEKTVIRGPFIVWPKPPWFVTHKRSTAVAKALVETTFQPKASGLLRLVYSALRG